MRYRKLDAQGDMIAGHGSADFITDIDAVAQAVRTRLLLFRGEWWEDIEDGLPLYQNIIGVRATQDAEAAMELLVRDRILRTEGVSEILSLESSIDPQNRLITYKTAIKTVYGVAELDEILRDDDTSFLGEDYLYHTHKIPTLTGRVSVNGVHYYMAPAAEENTGPVTFESYIAQNYLQHVHPLPAILGTIHISGRTYFMEAAPEGQTLGVDLGSGVNYAAHTHALPPLYGRITINGIHYYMEPADIGHTGMVNEQEGV
jgi:hypothetical protein